MSPATEAGQQFAPAAAGGPWITSVIVPHDLPVDGERLARLGLTFIPWHCNQQLEALLKDAQCLPHQALLVVAGQGSPAVVHPPGALLALTGGGMATCTCTRADVARRTTQLLQHVCAINTQRAQQQQQQQQQQRAAEPGGNGVLLVVVVGYFMKPSREQQLAEAGLLHVLPRGATDDPVPPPASSTSSTSTSSLVSFMPLDLEVPLDEQPCFHVLLHKGSDELVEVGGATTSASASASNSSTPAAGGAASDAAGAAPHAAAGAIGGGAAVTWSPRLLMVQQWLAQRPHVAVVDPFAHAAKVVDRCALHGLLSRLPALALPGGVRARPPRAVLVQDVQEQGGCAAVAAAGLAPPFIIKPLAACGVARSHRMALAASWRGLRRLQQAQQGGGVPLPALVQEFCNHGGVQAKAYVMGQQVFYSSRPSIPDIRVPPCSSAPAAAAAGAPAGPAGGTLPDAADGGGGDGSEHLLLFDSLASLPTCLPASWAASPASSHASAAAVDLEVLRALAGHLGDALQLSLFGFDVVVDAGTGDYVVVDVNYFPNYRGGGAQAPGWFRAVVLAAHAARAAAAAAAAAAVAVAGAGAGGGGGGGGAAVAAAGGAGL